MSKLNETELWLVNWFNANASVVAVDDPANKPVMAAFMIKDLAVALDEKHDEGKTDTCPHCGQPARPGSF